MGIRNSIRKWLDKWEKDLGKYLGWDESNPPVEGMGPVWTRWEEVWCEALGWNDCELIALWNPKDGKGNTACAVDALHIIRPTTVENEWNRQIALYLFYQAFRKAYVRANQKTEKNKDMNTKCKRRFIYLLFWSIIINIPLFLVYAVLFVLGISTSHFGMVVTFVVLALVLAALIFAKDLDIQKYQETWARHTRFQYHREQEMLRFLLEAEPYNQTDVNERVDAFVKAVLAIEEKNIEKFCLNMEDKEKGMLAEVLAITKVNGPDS